MLLKKNLIPIIIAGLIALLIIFYLFQGADTGVVYKKLPILGNHKLDTIMVDNKIKLDTIWHRIPDFSFLNQDGNEITQKNVEGKIYVVDFFFTTCKTICPVMSDEMNRVYQAFLNDPEVLILSHTVDPDTDQPVQMKSYAKQFDARSDKWMFLTGDKAALYAIARKGYLLEASVGTGGPTDFIHTQNFALIDHKRRIRGIYDGLEPEEINMLIKDIKSLKLELKRNG
jgi:protein SCO1/2